MPIVAAIFDAFGTVVHIGRKHHPFRQLLRMGTEQGRRPSTADIQTLMTSSFSLGQAAERFGIDVSPEQMLSLQRDLDDELASITVFPDAVDAMLLLKSKGILLGICSNLAQPYGPILRNLLPEVDGFALSFELGVMKPDAGIYHDICHQLGVRPLWDMGASSDRVVMIGDSLKCDQDGPRRIGISGYHLDRKGAGRFGNLLHFAKSVTGDEAN
ncbi:MULTISPECIES: HAD family hydrolase [Pseudomonas]|uniref:Haloacid dehalogenase n=1 Tax=Pseudomonas savastanoi pv. savastanoi NCPPB 3335 TaxID=693985 RepID=A0ABC8BIM4_PSESS|nr:MULTISPECIES: HAD family hydrolase [Pseudomonas]ARD13734.1 haloacid dehalogenase [Pseudomonas savastanoi pv. savastanoi NCPPB 3335]KAA3538435.1 HAD family hydrolase [Pseudomonas savastanoi]KWS75372.1 haloacid dehalogenase [Pseudomonas savastanoi pv. fraxini]MBA4706428.1 HAD family hydrolase [Pseudomonas savastanoi pv. savastanoi]PAB24736.1 haloacid dehalogenase [Pseudomonas savastanoi pv. fraxini]